MGSNTYATRGQQIQRTADKAMMSTNASNVNARAFIPRGDQKPPENIMNALSASSVNAERFIPQRKQLQWDMTPSIILIPSASRNGVLSSTILWLHGPEQRKSMFELCALNLLHFCEDGVNYLQESLYQSYAPFFNPWFLNTYQHILTQNYQIIQQNRFRVESLETRLNCRTLQPPPTLEEIIMNRSRQNVVQYSEERIIQTTPEHLARICDGIQRTIEEQQLGTNFSSYLQTAMELRDCLDMVCKDYLTKTFMLMDIERLKSMNDLKAYDMYSCRFDSVEIPPPVGKVNGCPGCHRKPKGYSEEMCLYHKFLSFDHRYVNPESMPRLEAIQGFNKPSIVKTDDQFARFEKMLKKPFNRNHEKEIIVHLTIPGIAENRPLVCIGDLVRFRFGFVEVIGDVREIQIKTERVMLFLPLPLVKNEHCIPYVKALITPKNRRELSLKKKHKNNGAHYRFDVRFGLFGSRAHDIFKVTATNAIANNMDRVMRVISPTPFLENILKRSARRPQTGISNWNHKNLNLEQKHAVFDIVRGNHGQAPYCIYGPPGKSLLLRKFKLIFHAWGSC